MKLSDIQSELLRLFSAGGDGGVVVSWHDPEGEFSDTLDALDLPGIEVVREVEGTRFALKGRLNGELAGQRVLLYRSDVPRTENDWLADVEVRAVRFSADYTSVQLRELGCADTEEMRTCLQGHRAFLAKRTNIKKLLKLRGGYPTPQELDLGIMAVALGAAEPEPEALLKAYLLAARSENGADGALAALSAVGSEGPFRAAVQFWTGFEGDVVDAGALAAHVLTSAFSRGISERLTAPLAGHFSAERADFCHSLFNEWVRSDKRGALLDICVESEPAVEAALAGTEASELAVAGVFPCVDKLILQQLFASIAEGPIGVDEVISLTDARRSSSWWECFSALYEGLRYAARCGATTGTTQTRLLALTPSAFGATTSRTSAGWTPGIASSDCHLGVPSSRPGTSWTRTSEPAWTRWSGSTRSGS